MAACDSHARAVMQSQYTENGLLEKIDGPLLSHPAEQGAKLHRDCKTGRDLQVLFRFRCCLAGLPARAPLLNDQLVIVKVDTESLAFINIEIVSCCLSLLVLEDLPISIMSIEIRLRYRDGSIQHLLLVQEYPYPPVLQRESGVSKLKSGHRKEG